MAERSGSALLETPLLLMGAPESRATYDDRLASPDSPTTDDPWSALRQMALVGLCAAIALPTRAGPPWALALHPADVTVVALAAAIMIAALHFLVSESVTRKRGAAIAAILLAPFGIQTLREAVARDQFDGHPLLTHLAASPILVASLLVGAIALLTGLITLPKAPLRLAARIAVGLGLCLLLLPALLPGPATTPLGVTTTGDLPLVALFSTLGYTPFLGDRLAAFALLLAIAIGIISIVLAIGPGRRHGFAVGVAAWLSLTAPLAILALFAARSDAWFDVFAPLKVVMFLAALVAFGASALGGLVAQRPSGSSPPRLDSGKAPG